MKTNKICKVCGKPIIEDNNQYTAGKDLIHEIPCARPNFLKGDVISNLKTHTY